MESVTNSKHLNQMKFLFLQFTIFIEHSLNIELNVAMDNRNWLVCLYEYKVAI